MKGFMRFVLQHLYEFIGLAVLIIGYAYAPNSTCWAIFLSAILIFIMLIIISIKFDLMLDNFKKDDESDEEEK